LSCGTIWHGQILVQIQDKQLNFIELYGTYPLFYEISGLTQTQAANLIYKGLRTWQDWETPEEKDGHRKMAPAFFAAAQDQNSSAQ
jgi:hypothetical protein